MSGSIPPDVYLRARLGAVETDRVHRKFIGDDAYVYFDVVNRLTGDLVPGATGFAGGFFVDAASGDDSPLQPADLTEVSPGVLGMVVRCAIPGAYTGRGQISYPSQQAAEIIWMVAGDGEVTVVGATQVPWNDVFSVAFGAAVSAARAETRSMVPGLAKPAAEAAAIAKIQPFVTQVDGDAIAVETSRQQVQANAGQAARDRAQTGQDREVTQAASGAAQTAAQQAAASASALGLLSMVGRPINDPAGWRVSRPSMRSGWDANGDLEQIAVDLAQGGYDRAGNYLGALFGPAVTNYLPNPNLLGAGDGLLAGNASPPLPTGWLVTTSAAGMKIQCTRVTVLGRSGLRLRYFADAPLTVAGTDVIEFSPRGAIATVTGQTRRNLFWYRLALGVMAAGAVMRAKILSRNSAGAAVNNASKTLVLDDTWRQADYPAVMGTGAVDISTGFQISWAAGTQPDVTIDITLPEQRTDLYPLPPVVPGPTASGPFSQAAETIDVPAQSLGTSLSRDQGTIYAELRSFGPFVSLRPEESMGVIGFGDGSVDNYIGLVINPAHTILEARLVRSGVANAVASVALTPPLANGRLKVGLSWTPTEVQVFAQGSFGSRVPVSVGIPAATRVMLGRIPGLPFAGAIAGLDLRPKATFDAAAAVLTS